MYLISSTGQVYSLKRNRLLTPQLNKAGYYHLRLDKKNEMVHTLVAKAFIPNPDNKPCVDHINTNTTDNRVENLRWVTVKENLNNPLTRVHMKDVWDRDGYNDMMREKFKGSHQCSWNGKTGYEHPMSKEVVREDGVRYGSVSEASRETGINRVSISDCCLGKQKTAGGFRWYFNI